MRRTQSRKTVGRVFSFPRFPAVGAVVVGASVLVAIVSAPVSTPIPSARSDARSAHNAPLAQASSASDQDAYGKLPLSFEKNVG